jgi:hypothetical protein
MKNQFVFKGAYIPAELFSDPSLDIVSFKLFAIIDLLDDPEKHCWASNKYFSAILGVSETSISTSLSYLKKQKYVDPVSFNGRIRVIKISESFKETHKNKAKEINNKHRNFEEDNSGDDEDEDEVRKNRQSIMELKGSIKADLKKIKDNNINRRISSSKEELSDDESSPCNLPKNEFPIREEDPIKEKPYRHRLNKLQYSLETRRERIRHQSYIEYWACVALEEEKASKSIPENIALLIEHWDGLGLKATDSKRAPKGYASIVKSLRKLIKGSLIPGQAKFSEETIKEVMTTFSISALNNDYEPSNPEYKLRLSKMSLSEFLYNPNAKRNTSLFLKYHEEGLEPSRKNQQSIEDPNPNITNKIKRFYINYALGGTKTILKESEENKFRLATKQILEFYKANKYKLQGLDNGVTELADFLCDAIKDQYGDNVERVYPGSFCSSAALSCLIKRLNSEGMIEESSSAALLYDVGNETYERVYKKESEEDNIVDPEPSVQTSGQTFDPYGNGDPDWLRSLSPEEQAKYRL